MNLQETQVLNKQTLSENVFRTCYRGILELQRDPAPTREWDIALRFCGLNYRLAAKRLLAYGYDQTDRRAIKVSLRAIKAQEDTAFAVAHSGEVG